MGGVKLRYTAGHAKYKLLERHVTSGNKYLVTYTTHWLRTRYIHVLLIGDNRIGCWPIKNILGKIYTCDVQTLVKISARQT